MLLLSEETVETRMIGVVVVRGNCVLSEETVETRLIGVVVVRGNCRDKGDWCCCCQMKL